ncbi:hypothetical protein [Latilactobacillus sakei]|uniref:LaaP n=1 Tax=Latilactobacillus sakei TaxID=1599 RepID=A0AAE8J3W0_LATSK|nr:hypothetical protein [Latilactobacillus sakei]USS38119.1 hypothetical protein NC516_06895 [Latilactobacillus sakei]SPE19617.1 hypothetical protein LAS9267_00586 [Latilactobacillus sakei]
MTILLTILLIISTITSIYYFTKHPYHRRFWLSLTFLLVAIIGLGTTNTLINAASASKTKVQHVSKKEGQRAKQEALANSTSLKKQLAAKKSEASSLSIAVSEQEAATESSVQSTATVDTTQTTTNQAEEMVTVAPTAGKKYHLDANCRGLKRATSTTTMTLAEAQAQGYTLCGWED